MKSAQHSRCLFGRPALVAALFVSASVALLSASCSHPPAATRPAPTDIDWQAVAAALGTELHIEDDGVRAADFPRTDLTVVNDGVHLVPGMELGSEVMFTPTGGKDALACGEFTLTGPELNPVIARLESGGVEVTAIHKHLPDESPQLWWLHYLGRGDPARTAATLRQALDATGTPTTEASAPPGPPLDTATIDRIVRHTGMMEDGAYQVHVPLNVAVTDTKTGIMLPYLMEASNLLMFQPLAADRVAVNGDFAMTADQIDPVIRALQSHGIDIVSLHSHLTDEAPTLYYMHFWATGAPAALAGGLRAGLDAVHAG